MSVSNEVQGKQFDNDELDNLSHRERLVLQMFRQLDQQRQKDILRFIDVLLSEK